MLEIGWIKYDNHYIQKLMEENRELKVKNEIYNANMLKLLSNLINDLKNK